MSLLSPDFVLREVTWDDITIASLAWGFTIGFGWLTTWTAIRQTLQVYRRVGVRHMMRSAYVWMVWGELIACLTMSIMSWLHLKGTIPPSFLLYFSLVTIWAFQVHFLLQIIINRCALLLPDKRFAWRLKVAVAIIVTAINISVYCIWIPARLQISPRYVWINQCWDRAEKGCYLLIDAGLNIYFIRIVQRDLVQNGLGKYKSLVQFNISIIGFSLSMDVLIIAMMSLENASVYMQFHPLAYIVKLHIEMSMADLIVKIAQGSQERRWQAANQQSFMERGDVFCGCVSQSNAAMRSGNQTKITSTGRNHLATNAIATEQHNKIILEENDEFDSEAGGLELSTLEEIEQQSASKSVTLCLASKSAANERIVADGIYETKEIRVEFEQAPGGLEVGPRSPDSIDESVDGSSHKSHKREDDTRPLRDCC